MHCIKIRRFQCFVILIKIMQEDTTFRNHAVLRSLQCREFRNKFLKSNSCGTAEGDELSLDVNEFHRGKLRGEPK